MWTGHCVFEHFSSFFAVQYSIDPAIKLSKYSLETFLSLLSILSDLEIIKGDE